MGLFVLPMEWIESLDLSPGTSSSSPPCSTPASHAFCSYFIVATQYHIPSLQPTNPTCLNSPLVLLLPFHLTQPRAMDSKEQPPTPPLPPTVPYEQPYVPSEPIASSSPPISSQPPAAPPMIPLPTTAYKLPNEEFSTSLFGCTPKSCLMAWCWSVPQAPPTFVPRSY